jgi:ketosteroid isomerase-like protein
MPTKQRVQDLIAYVERGDFPEAIERFYDEHVVMRENLSAPTVGRAANVERERQFKSYIATLHESTAKDVLIEGDRVVINWILDFTGTDGKRMRFDQLAVQHWQGDRIVEERFVYDSATLTAAA